MSNTRSRFFVISDMSSKVREAFVASEDEYPEMSKSYSGYFIKEIFENEQQAQEYCGRYNDYEDDQNVYVIDDFKVDNREAFVASSKEASYALANYSGYEIVGTFLNIEEAEAYCLEYNNREEEEYDDDDDDFDDIDIIDE